MTYQIKACIFITIPAVYTGQVAFSYVDTRTGHSVCGLVSGGPSNVTAAVREFLDWSQMCYTERLLPNRRWRQYIDQMPYAGCTHETIVPFIHRHLKLAAKTERDARKAERLQSEQLRAAAQQENP